MNSLNPKIDSGFNLKRFLAITAIMLLVIYGLFNAKHLIVGPSIEIFNPLAYETETDENVIVVRGRAQNTAFLSLNERQIFVNTEGFFEEKLLLTEGFNIISIKARDRFKKEVEKTAKIYYKQSTSTTVYKENSSEGESLE